MTDAEKVEAFRMRLEGYSLQEIGDRFGISRQAVDSMLKRTAKADHYATHYKSAYEGINRYLAKNRMSVSALSKEIGVSQNALYISLRAGNGMTKHTIDRLLEVTGMTYEEAFKSAAESEATNAAAS